MTVKFEGPVLNKQGLGPTREWYDGLPIQFDPDYAVFQDDFMRDLDTSNVWAVVKDSSAAVAIASDVLHGEVTLTSQATTDDDGSTLQTKNEFVDLTAGKTIWFEARVKVSDADDMDAFVGLVRNISSDPEAVLTDADRVGFQLNDGDATLVAKTEKGGTETSSDTEETLSDDTYVKLGMKILGTSAVEFYVDGVKVETHSTNLPDDEQLAVTFFELSGSASGTKKMTVDYVIVVSER